MQPDDATTRVADAGDRRRIAARSEAVQREMEFVRELGDVFEISIVGSTLIVVGGGDAVAEAFDESRFTKAVVPPVSNLRELAGDGLFTAFNREPAWAQAHNVLMPAFSQSSMRS
ncbi:hypothetical protein ACFWB0_11055 [Rhodococcus sp. NPDC060086]|uniref:hypothetical protein n=1 Tax=Rhodococcus sp. NPDC060086 TaxID=3347055 RepID=UPI00364E4E36